MAGVARRWNADETVAVATSAVREAPNRDDFLDGVERATGIRVNVISGEEEADFGGTRGRTAPLQSGGHASGHRRKSASRPRWRGRKFGVQNGQSLSMGHSAVETCCDGRFSSNAHRSDRCRTRFRGRRARRLRLRSPRASARFRHRSLASLRNATRDERAWHPDDE